MGGINGGLLWWVSEVGISEWCRLAVMGVAEVGVAIANADIGCYLNQCLV